VTARSSGPAAAPTGPRARAGRFWTQHRPWTCGPAALANLLGLAAEVPRGLELAVELAVWKAATTHECPGSHPLGLALAARARGYHPEVYRSGTGPWLGPHLLHDHGLRSLDRYVRVERAYSDRCRVGGIPVREGVSAAPRRLQAPGLLLVDASPAEGPERIPHWVARIPLDAGGIILDPERDAPFASGEGGTAAWARSGFDGERTFVAVPDAPAYRGPPVRAGRPARRAERGARA
jgi:hypothetical protein